MSPNGQFSEFDKTYELFDLHKVESVETPEKTINKRPSKKKFTSSPRKDTQGGYGLGKF